MTREIGSSCANDRPLLNRPPSPILSSLVHSSPSQTNRPVSPILVSPRGTTSGSTAAAVRGALGVLSPVAAVMPSSPNSPRAVLPPGELFVAADSPSRSPGGRTGSIRDLGPSSSRSSPEKLTFSPETGADPERCQTSEHQNSVTDQDSRVAFGGDEAEDRAELVSLAREISQQEDELITNHSRGLARTFALAAQTLQHHLLMCVKLLGAMLERHPAFAVAKPVRVPLGAVEDSHPKESLQQHAEVPNISLPSPRLPECLEGALRDPPGLPWRLPNGAVEADAKRLEDPGTASFLLATAMLDAALRLALDSTRTTQAQCLNELPETRNALQDDLVTFDGTLTTVYEDEDAETKLDRSEVPYERPVTTDEFQTLRSEYLRILTALPSARRRRADALARLEEVEAALATINSELEFEGEADEDAKQRKDSESTTTIKLDELDIPVVRRFQPSHGGKTEAMNSACIDGIEISQAALSDILAQLSSLRREVRAQQVARETSEKLSLEASLKSASWEQERQVLVSVVKSAGIEVSDDLCLAIHQLQQQAASVEAARSQQPLRRPNSRSRDPTVTGATTQGTSRANSALPDSERSRNILTENAASEGRSAPSTSRGKKAHVAAVIEPPAAGAQDAEIALKELSAMYAEVQRQYQKMANENLRLREALESQGMPPGEEAQPRLRSDRSEDLPSMPTGARTSASPCNAPQFPGIPSWPSTTLITRPAPARGPSSPGPTPCRAAASTLQVSSPASRRPLCSRKHAEEGVGRHSNAVSPSGQKSSGSTVGGRLPQSQHPTNFPTSATNSPAAAKSPQVTAPRQQVKRPGAIALGAGNLPERRQSSNTRPAGRLVVKMPSDIRAKAYGDTCHGVAVRSPSLEGRWQDLADQQPAPEPLPESGLPSPLPPVTLPGSAQNSARSPRTSPQTPLVPTQTANSSRNATTGDVMSARNASSISLARPVSVPRSWEEQQHLQQAQQFHSQLQHSLAQSPQQCQQFQQTVRLKQLQQLQQQQVHQLRLQSQPREEIQRSLSQQAFLGSETRFSWGSPSRSCSPDCFEPVVVDTAAVSPVRRPIDSAFVGPILRRTLPNAGSSGQLQHPSPPPASCLRPSSATVSSPSWASASGNSIPAGSRPPQRQLPPQVSAGSPTVVRKIVQSSSSHSLAARPPSPSPRLAKSASAHSIVNASLSPEPRPRSPIVPVAAIVDRTASPRMMSPVSEFQQESQASAMTVAALVAAQNLRSGHSRITWPTPAIHAQLMQAVGGLATPLSAQVVSRTTVVQPLSSRELRQAL